MPRSISQTVPAHDAIAITPNDSTDLAATCCLTCTGSGEASVDTVGGTTVTVSLVAGAVLPLAVQRVRATGTTATGIVGLVI